MYLKYTALIKKPFKAQSLFLAFKVCHFNAYINN